MDIWVLVCVSLMKYVGCRIFHDQVIRGRKGREGLTWFLSSRAFSIFWTVKRNFFDKWCLLGGWVCGWFSDFIVFCILGFLTSITSLFFCHDQTFKGYLPHCVSLFVRLTTSEPEAFGSPSFNSPGTSVVVFTRSSVHLFFLGRSQIDPVFCNVYLTLYLGKASRSWLWWLQLLIFPFIYKL